MTSRVHYLASLMLLLPTTWAMADEKTGAAKDTLPAGAAARLGNARFLNLGRVFSVSYSHDGRLVAGGAWDGSIRVWESATGKEILRLDGHKRPVQKVVFASDDKTLVSVGKLPGVCLWEIQTGRLANTFGSDKDEASDVSYSPDGRKIGAILRGTLYVWDMAGKQLWSQGGDRIHTHFAFREPDSLTSLYLKPLARVNKRVFPDFNSHVHLSAWSLPAGKEQEVQDLGALGPAGTDACFGSDGRLLALHTIIEWGRDEQIKFLHTRRREPAQEIHVAGQNVSVLEISPDRRMLALTGDSWGDEAERKLKFIRVFEIATGQERCRFRSLDEGKVCLAFSPDGRTLASGSLDVTVLLWDLTGGAAGGKQSLTAADLDKLWDDLKSSDAAAAYRAHWKLVVAAKPAVPFLAHHLGPVAAPDLVRMTALVRDLADNRFRTRRQATTELLKLGELAEAPLLDGLRSNPDLEARRRIEDLLKRLNQLSPEQLRHHRAVEVLEHMGTPPALALLRRLAGGFAGALVTRAAREACHRLEEKMR